MHANTKDLNPKGDGSFQHDADTTTTTDTSDTQHEVNGSQTKQPQPSISEARLRSNRQNARKSTGPKTARGKDYSRRNAVKHGLLSKQLLFSHDGQPINEELHQLWERLHEKYGDGDIRTNLLVDGLVIEHWRQRQALVVEVSCFKSVAEAQWHYGPQGTMSNLQRYRTASQRALLKNLELLDELPPPTSEDDEDEAEDETPIPQPENPPRVPEPSSGLAVVADAQGSPESGLQSEIETTSGEDSTPTGEVEKAA